MSTPAHQDSGFLTLLQTFGYPGLEILLGDEWLSVQVETFPRPGANFISLIGSDCWKFHYLKNLTENG